MACPACGKINTVKTGVPFPADSSKYVRYCLQLQLSPKDVDRNKALICYEHFDSKDLVKEDSRVIGVTRLAIPRKYQKLTLVNIDTRSGSNTTPQITLDQVLAKNLGIGITQAPSSPQYQTTQMSNQSGNFNFQNQMNRATISSPSLNQQAYEMGIFGFPRNSKSTQQITEINTTSNFNGVYQQQNELHLSKLEFLTDIIRRTLVLYRHRKPGNSPAIDQKYFKEWLLNSFNLPEKAIFEMSQVSNIKNLYVIHIILDEKLTLDSVLQMYESESTSPNSYQCILRDASAVLQEGALILKRQRFNGEVLDKPNLDECFKLLLRLESEQNMECENNNALPKFPVQLDDSDSVWRNIAAEMLPAFRNMIAATTSQTSTIQPTNFINFPTAISQISSSTVNKQPRNPTQ